MKSTNRIHIFFIIVALVFWNPLSFYIIYGNTYAYTFKLIHFLFGFVFVMGCLVIWLHKREKIGPRLSNFIFVFSFMGILFSLGVLVNGLIGLFGPSAQISKIKREGFLFPPGSTVHNRTTEFSYTANINSIGLRDREISIDKGNAYRICCFGDSWTYGWGVDIENTWVKKLESFLRARTNKNIEVINCGKPGACPDTYKEDIEKIIPVLKPDMVILGVLQLDDLAQLYEHEFPAPYPREKITFGKKIKKAAETLFVCSFGNILPLPKTSFSENTMRKNRQKTVTDIMNALTPAQRANYNTLDDTAKTLLLSGDLNIGNFFYTIYTPGRISIYNDPGQEATKFAMSEMNKDLKAIKSICDQYKSKVVFMNLPGHFFTGHKVSIGKNDTLNSYFENNNKIDSIYKAIAVKNGLAYFEMTKEFRELEDKTSYFFKYDCHPTAKGQDKIASLAGGYLLNSKLLNESSR